jgi:hypothetical protein
MNESFTVKFMENNTLWPVTKADVDLGIIVANENDAWPRRCELSIVPQTPGTRFRMKDIAHANEWQFPEYHFNLGVVGGGLVFSGVDKEGLPAGTYSVSIDVEDLPTTKGPFDVTMPENGSATMIVPVQTDHRPLVLSDPLPAEIRRVLQASTLDGRPAMEWISDSSRRLNRRACLLNLLIKLCSIPYWIPGADPLITRVESIFFARTERIYATITPGFYEDVQSFVDAHQHFYAEGRPAASVHQDLYDLLKLDPNEYEPLSFREEGQRSMQAVVARPKHGGKYYVDLDIDLGNPLQDVEGIIIHLTELLGSDVTDHVALSTELATDATTKPFMCYNIPGADT